MRLKKRLCLGLFATVLVATVTFLTASVYIHYSEDHQVKEHVVHDMITNAKTNLQRRVFQELVNIRPPVTKKENMQKRKNRKRKKLKPRPVNETNLDSNHAAEVELSYEESHRKEKSLLRPSTSPIFQSQKSSSSDQNLKSKFINECLNPNPTPDPEDDRHDFSDLVQILQNAKAYYAKSGKKRRRNRITMQDIHEIKVEQNLTLMELFHLGISDQDMYRENDPVVDSLLEDMNKNQIVHVEEKAGGTQLKLIITFFDGSQAMMKPMRFDRDKETLPDHFYFVDFERHNSEIAAFHLDRILGFRRCPPVVGRKLNITTEIYSVADDDLLKTFFISPAQNYCFHGQCSYYCDTSHAICGHPDDLEGSLAAYLPPDQLSGRKSWKNPWKRSYHKRRKAKWETNSNYCEEVRKEPLYDNSKRLADLIDVSILDFLIGNMDRHHYETFKIFGNDSFILHLDHGRGFGKSKHDEYSILAPLYQCCFIHVTTFERLLQLQMSPMRLSTFMRCSLFSDPLNPILNEDHLAALDRRLQIILHVLRKCFERKDSKKIIFFGKGHNT